MLDLLRFLYDIPVFILTAVHELGHAGAALLLGWRVRSIRALGVRVRIRGRRHSVWSHTLTLHRVAYRKHDYGEVITDLPRGRQNPISEIFFSSAGYLAEGALLWWLWVIVPPHVAGTNAAYALFALLWFSGMSIMCALTDDKGSDLYFVLRDMRKIGRKLAR